MSTKTTFIETVNSVIQNGVNQGILHLTANRVLMNSASIQVGEHDIVNFGSCSYLGLEYHPLMMNSSRQAISDFGTQFSSSRAYLSIGLYKELEGLLQAVFSRHVVIAQTTSLAHIASLPVFVKEGDAVILDHQVHNSVQTAAQILKAKNIPVEMIRHNRMDLLEERIIDLRQRHDKVWYLADGIYSMYGDEAPCEELNRLLSKYKEFHLYIDDAHGMSCYGKNGQGYVMTNLGKNEKAIVVVSLNKSFASGGSAILLPTKEMASLVRTCGGPLITSGPLQPAQLGAAIAAAKIHLSEEIYDLQFKLHENIKYANLLLHKFGLPLVYQSDTPVFYIAAGNPSFSYSVIRKMKNDGYYLNLGAFPAVPMKNSGIRFTITAVHTFDQILGMITSLNKNYYETLNEENTIIDTICKAFKMNVPINFKIQRESEKKSNPLRVFKYKSINDFDNKEWDSVMMDKGIFDSEGMRFLERSFKNHNEELNNWQFDYLIVKDENDRIILATFFTNAWMKDDMLASESISYSIEEIRVLKSDNYYKSSQILMTGSLFSEGEHVFLDRSSEKSHEALAILYKEAELLMENYQSAGILIRDWSGDDQMIDEVMNENAFFKLPMPVAYEVNFTAELTDEEYFSRLSANARQNLKKEVLRYHHLYQCEVKESLSDSETKLMYNLYLQVKNASLQLNTFPLPRNLFTEMNHHPNWEFLVLREVSSERIVAIICAYKSEQVYQPMLIGVDKTISTKASPYRQLLYRTVLHAKNKGFKKIRLGFSADVEKKKIGASAFEVKAFMQAKDNYMFESLSYASSEMSKLRK